MIPKAEVHRRAQSLGIQEAHVLRDYVLNHVLVSIGQSIPELIFRGGTSLARVYWPDFRLSEDLDFIAEGRVVDLQDRLRVSVTESSTRIDRPLTLRFGTPRGGWSRSTVESEFGELLIDINLEENVYLPVKEEGLHLPYSDLDERVGIRCISIPEILGNKWFMLDDRKEPRDLYDLWAALTRFGVSFELVDRGHRAKYGYPARRHSLTAARQLHGKWEMRLRHQLSELPSLDEVLREVEELFDAWATASTNDS